MDQIHSNRLNKDYIVEKCIGKGVFSEVFQVLNLRNNKTYAMKKVSIDDIADRDLRNDCFNEVNLLRITDHSNIIRFIDYEFRSSANKSCLYLVLELACNGDLHQFILRHIDAPMLVPEKMIWKFSFQLSSALSYLHVHHIMHRDIKPANIFLSENEDIKLGDFGFGTFQPHFDKSYTTVVLGSPYYMSPERLLRQKYDFNSDVWSMGCVIYELAALQSPFLISKLDLDLLIRRILKRDYAPIPCDIYSKMLEEIIDLCLTLNFTKRPDAEYLRNFISIVMNEFLKD